MDEHDTVRIQLNWQQTELEGKSGLFAQTTSLNLGRTWTSPVYVDQYNVVSTRPLFALAYTHNLTILTYNKYQDELKVIISKDGTRIKGLTLWGKAYSAVMCVSANRVFVLQNSMFYLSMWFINLWTQTAVLVDFDVYPKTYVDVQAAGVYLDFEKNTVLRALADVNVWPSRSASRVELLTKMHA